MFTSFKNCSQIKKMLTSLKIFSNSNKVLRIEKCSWIPKCSGFKKCSCFEQMFTDSKMFMIFSKNVHKNHKGSWITKNVHRLKNVNEFETVFIHYKTNVHQTNNVHEFPKLFPKKRLSIQKMFADSKNVHELRKNVRVFTKLFMIFYKIYMNLMFMITYKMFMNKKNIHNFRNVHNWKKDVLQRKKKKLDMKR